MTESMPQQPGYPADEQQAAAYAQQQAYAAQQQQAMYAQQQAYMQQQPAAPNFLTKLPMNQATFGLAVGGAFALLISLILHGAGSDAILFMRALSPFSLAPMYAILVLTGIAITTGSKLRNTIRTVVLGLSIIEIGTTISIFMVDTSSQENPLTGQSSKVDTTNSAPDIIAVLLYIIAIGLLASATFTMKDRGSQQNSGYPQATGQQFSQPQAAAQPQAQPPVQPQTNQQPQQYPGQQDWTQ